ncbi:Serine/threonine-protein kinase TOR [Apostasia shenzhenica]|uniref:non-specific serine/threonine protein kinase n=1 Tax=Apostasia shenzhenica TaxID=1088818 RepID=A0A2I0A9H7_9ASPA|nr:Serine/threonine-protein kinase TOR [Apostasia shenzhenica]
MSEIHAFTLSAEAVKFDSKIIAVTCTTSECVDLRHQKGESNFHAEAFRGENNRTLHGGEVKFGGERKGRVRSNLVTNLLLFRRFPTRSVPIRSDGLPTLQPEKRGAACMMEGSLHQLQQQLTASLSAAYPQIVGAATVRSDDSVFHISQDEKASVNGTDESARIAAIESLRRTIVYPPNALFLPHCAHFLLQGFSQLLSDKSYGVRQAAAVAYASLSAILASTTLPPSGLHNHVLSGGLVDRFLCWALSLFQEISVRNGSTVLALDSLREFLSIGDAISIERYIPSILKACKELLEDEGTDLSLFNQLLSILTLISLKFAHCFQPHFIDIIDLLLGWAFMSDLSDSGRSMIIGCFLQFQRHWVSNLQFSLGLLSKFLGDAEVLVHDVNLKTTEQLGRLLPLFSCFSTILQATASGMLEMNLVVNISEPLENMIPQLLRCILLFGRKFGWSKWMEGSWRCIILLAEILHEKFSPFYPMVTDILFQSLMEIPSYQVYGLLKTNLQLLSLQKLGLLPSSVQILLHFNTPLSQLRLHPNHLVVASSAATYLCFLQHGCDDVVSQAVTSLLEELELFRSMLAELLQRAVESTHTQVDNGTFVKGKSNLVCGRQFSDIDLLSLVEFDFKVLLCSLSVDAGGGFAITDAKRYEMSARITSFILDKFLPFEFPVKVFHHIQAYVVKAFYKFSEVEFLAKFRDTTNSVETASVKMGVEDQSTFEASNKQHFLIAEYLSKFTGSMLTSLNDSSPLTVKIETLAWVCTFVQMVIRTKDDEQLRRPFGKPFRDATFSPHFLFCIVDAAFDRELKVRFHAGSVLEVLLHAGVIPPQFFCFVSAAVINKLSDPEMIIRKASARLFCNAVIVTIFMHGFTCVDYFCEHTPTSEASMYNLNWKQEFAFKLMPQKFQSLKVLSILSYISHGWKIPPSSWVRRLVFRCPGQRDGILNQQEMIADLVSEICEDAKEDEFFLQKICPVNNLAAIWWSIHEAARYCINLRLRTNLGGPTQTFATLERMLLDIPNVLKMDFEQDETPYLVSSNFHLLPMRLLLDFVEALKKYSYNAYEGSAFLTSVSQQSSLFFRANKKVCEEWFSRISDPMLNACLALNCHDATYFYCSSRLQDLKDQVTSTLKDQRHGFPENYQNIREKFAGDILKVLQHASLALCKCHEPEALIGLQKWAGRMFSAFSVDDNPFSPSVAGSEMCFSWMTGLVYQAQGQYEKAAAHFSDLLQSEEALTAMGSDGIQFLVSRVIESYASLSDWKSLEAWLSELHGLRSMHAGKPYAGALTAAGNEMNVIHALACFDEGDVQAAWSYLELTPKSSCKLTLDPHVAFERSEQMLLRSMLQRQVGADNVLENLNKAKLMLDEALSSIPLDGLSEAAAFAAQIHCIHALEECTGSNGQLSPIVGSLSRALHSPISRIQDSALWIKIFRAYRTIMPNSYVTMLLGQRLLSLARKQCNFRLADRLKKYLGERSFPEHEHADFLANNLQYEIILLKHAEGKHEEAFLDLWSFVRSDILPGTMSISTKISNIKAKACLKLSSWMNLESSNTNMRNVVYNVCENCIIHRADGISISSRGFFSTNNDNQTSDAMWTAVTEEIIGAAIKQSCYLCPEMGKAWLSYAAWCFTRATNSLSVHGSLLQSCSLGSVIDEGASPVKFQLTKDEKSKLKDIFISICQRIKHTKVQEDEESGDFDSFSYTECQSFLDSLVREAVHLIEEASGTPALESFEGECPAILFSQLQGLLIGKIPCLEKTDTSTYIEDLIDIWSLLRKRRVSLFGHAAHGYFQFLLHPSFSLMESNSTDIYPKKLKEKLKSYTLRAMLYILVILLNYGVELEETLKQGFATVSPLPWQEIIPQLFARVSSHPKQAVRKQVEGLLLMLTKLSPWSIVYPLLVDMNSYEGQFSEELQNIHNCLGKLYPKLIQDVRLVINELGTVTVLWEEQWLSTLQDLHTDVVRRINTLKEESARIAENSTLSNTEKDKINAVKYAVMMSPIVVALERRLAATSREPGTVHEVWFQKEYGKQLKSAILAFKTPPASASALGDVWRSFHSITASLAVNQRKSFIHLSEVSPRLALFSSSDVPMPGLERQTSLLAGYESYADNVKGIVTVSSFSEEVEILSTKTRPKKLILLGSDGLRYTYLLKGREDLRLDARIMQLLQVINCFLSSSDDGLSHSLGIRYYSVTPISGQAGLIQWVDNVTSIYSIYKSWQNRYQLAQSFTTTSIHIKNPAPPIPRPIDMFYGKIIPALKEMGIRRVISRRDWPHEVKRKVLLDLMKETPRNLLWQELWCASEGMKAFHLKTKRFSGSVAAMSIVGHVIGLGDRHLDNVLMDFNSGEVVHIDYNVCFDKGKRLKIPEIVPFRLTQTIEAALGLTGTEGLFRANCETVLNMLRKNKDIVVMLLEVFVWDPLVEWTREDKHDEAEIGGEEKKGMELAVSLSLFASRFQENRVPLQEHHDLLLSTLPAAESSLKRFLDVLTQFEFVSAIFCHVDKERSSLLQHERTLKSIAAEATSVSDKSRAYFEGQALEFAQAKTIAAEKAQEAAAWIEDHGRVINILRSGSFPGSHSCIEFRGMEKDLSLISAVLVSGVPLTVVPEPTQAQCSDLDRELSQIIIELDNKLSSAAEALNEYSFTLQRVLPLNYITTSPVHCWAQVLQLSVNNTSSEVLSLARRQVGDITMKSKGGGLDSVHMRHRDLMSSIETYAIEIETANKEYFDLMNSIGTDSEAKYKVRFLSAFTQLVQCADYAGREDDLPLVSSWQHNCDVSRNLTVLEDHDEKRGRVLCVIYTAMNELYEDVKKNLGFISFISNRRISLEANEYLQNDYDNYHGLLEKQIEKCVLLEGIVDEIRKSFDIDIGRFNTDRYKITSRWNWPSVFEEILWSIRSLIENVTGCALPEIIRSVVSFNSEVMETFGSLSQLRSSIDAALEKLAEVELERESLLELEKNYFMKVGLITEEQLSLEEAAVKGRDHLSWEEAEELVTQGEACRARLDQLHQSWNHRDVQITFLERIEDNIRDSLSSAEGYFSSLISIEQDVNLHPRSKALLAALVDPFTELESIDHTLPLYTSDSYLNDSSHSLSDLLTSSLPLSHSIWKFSYIPKKQSFFIWKVSVVDSILDSCLHNISSSVDCNFSFEQLCNVLKKKVEVLLHEHLGLYLKERVAAALLAQLNKETDNIHQIIEVMNGFISKEAKIDYESVTKVRIMLEEYCNAHETGRAARTALGTMKRSVSDLTEAFHKTTLEILLIEWLHEQSLPQLLKEHVFSQEAFGYNKLASSALSTGRKKLLEKMHFSISYISRSLECLQSLEKTSISMEGQLERAMGWACSGLNNVGANGSSTKDFGIPSEFHAHLMRRRKLIWSVHDQASNIIKACTSVIEFEASRDGLGGLQVDKFSGWTAADSQTWQQAYLTAFTRLDNAYQSFAYAEQEWKLSQKKNEAAAKGLLSVTEDLCIASIKANSASGDLQDNLTTLCRCVHEASLALSSFSGVAKRNTSLTSECGSMLEEVLVITKGLDDVYVLAKEASAAHAALVTDLSKVSMILLPLEASLTSDIAATTEAMSKEKESNAEVSLVHGQALYQSYYFKLQETCQSLASLVPAIIFYVKQLYSMLTKLTRAASMHAGNLHKALERLGVSQVVRSQELPLSKPEVSDGIYETGKIFFGSDDNTLNEITFPSHDEGWISPLLDSYASSQGFVIDFNGEENSNNLDFGWPDFSFGEKNNLGEDSMSDEKSKSGILNNQADASCSTLFVSLDPSETIESVVVSDCNPSSIEKCTSGDAKSSDSSNGKCLLYPFKASEGNNEDPTLSSPSHRIQRVKNAYAMSVMRQVEMKIEGLVTEDGRVLQTPQQVDRLIMEAKSIDNLCNMYEGGGNSESHGLLILHSTLSQKASCDCSQYMEIT